MQIWKRTAISTKVRVWHIRITWIVIIQYTGTFGQWNRYNNSKSYSDFKNNFENIFKEGGFLISLRNELLGSHQLQQQPKQLPANMQQWTVYKTDAQSHATAQFNAIYAKLIIELNSNFMMERGKVCTVVLGYWKTNEQTKNFTRRLIMRKFQFIKMIRLGHVVRNVTVWNMLVAPERWELLAKTPQIMGFCKILHVKMTKFSKRLFAFFLVNSGQILQYDR